MIRRLIYPRSNGTSCHAQETFTASETVYGLPKKHKIRVEARSDSLGLWLCTGSLKDSDGTL